ncbi:PREDICTED: heat shock protein beta-6-like [Branchiostoma belcheri]|uniref:Heat shock protein beta-6-like n=1 Tax=Branchiostoma belcheri TaxID=7741 RepID=A0A6P4Y9J6_BRABE|nr:PREDICTED: heat shock protein beta-6-like [Branchiostoma belcheri]
MEKTIPISPSPDVLSPRAFFEQHFGQGAWEKQFLGANDDKAWDSLSKSPRSLFQFPPPATAPSIGQDKFYVELDMKDYTPEQITVKTIDGKKLVIHAKKVETLEVSGRKVTKEFSREYVIPPLVDYETISSYITAEGVLTVQSADQPPVQAAPPPALVKPSGRTGATGFKTKTTIGFNT